MGLISLPFRGLLRVFEEVAGRAEAERGGEDATQAELIELHRKLEAGAVSEQEFGEREAELVARLDELAAQAPRGGRHVGR